MQNITKNILSHIVSTFPVISCVQYKYYFFIHEVKQSCIFPTQSEGGCAQKLPDKDEIHGGLLPRVETLGGQYINTFTGVELKVIVVYVELKGLMITLCYALKYIFDLHS